jgi:hypothetical protein
VSALAGSMFLAAFGPLRFFNWIVDWSRRCLSFGSHNPPFSIPFRAEQNRVSV